MSKQSIELKGVRVHNLKNIDLNIKLNQFVVITGVSGSGKSSLAFDTLYAEGQRRYVESLSSYARQFLGRLNKPECDYIKGIPPAVAIEQKVNTSNPRSTVGTSTELYDYIKLLYARIGKTYSPISGEEVKRHSVDDIYSYILEGHTDQTVVIMAKLAETTNENLPLLISQGFSRIKYGDEFIRISDLIEKNIPGNLEKFGKIAKLLGENVTGLSKWEAAHCAIIAVQKLAVDLRIPSKLTEVGVTKEMFPAIIKGTMEYRLLAVNPVKITEQDVEEILEKAYE